MAAVEAAAAVVVAVVVVEVVVVAVAGAVAVAVAIVVVTAAFIVVVFKREVQTTYINPSPVGSYLINLNLPPTVLSFQSLYA